MLFTFFLSFIRMCVGTESKLYQVIIPFLPREWMLDARGRVLGSSLREIRCRINWRESLSTVKVTKVDQRNQGKNWEGFAVSFGTHEFRRSRASRLGNDIQCRMTRTLSSLAKQLPPLLRSYDTLLQRIFIDQFVAIIFITPVR